MPHKFTKVREYIRKSKYLEQSKQCKAHYSLDGKKALAQGLVHFTTIAENNIKQYINERALENDITIKPIYITHEEAEQETSLLNVTTNEPKVKIFQTLKMLDAETSKMMEEVYNRSVKNRKKENYIEFYYKLCDILDDNEVSVIEDNDNTSD